MLFVIFIYTGILAYKLWGQWAQCQIQIYPKTGTHERISRLWIICDLLAAKALSIRSLRNPTQDVMTFLTP